jgi:MFS family permease
LRFRDFRILLAGTMALQVGSWVQAIGMGWLVLHDLAGSATALAIVALLRGASQLLLAPIAGHMAGRYERRGQLLWYTGLSGIVAVLITFLIAAQLIEIWMVFVLAALAGVADAMAGPIRMLLVYDAVGGEELSNAVALNGIGGNAMRVIGPAIGGTLIGLLGTQGAFQMQAVCILVAVVLTWMLRQSQPEQAEGTNMWRSIGAGAAYVWRDRPLRIVVAMAVLPSFLVYPYVTFLPVFARDVFGSDETGYGYLAAAVGVGSLFGGAVVVLQSRNARIVPLMMWGCVLYCLSIAAFTIVRDLWIGVAILCTAGVFHSIYSALNSTLMQLIPTPDFRGRVMSLQTMTWGVTPFSALAMGRMVDLWGAPVVVGSWVSAGLLVSMVVALSSRGLYRNWDASATMS